MASSTKSLKNYILFCSTQSQMTATPLSHMSSVLIQIPNNENDEELKLVDKVERVPPLFRNKQTHCDAYNPVIVSIGPYYHGNPEYHHAELFKQETLKAFVSDIQMDKSFVYDKIMERIEDIRACYEPLDDKYEDKDLAWMIVHDACFFIYYVKNHTPKFSKLSILLYKYFGPARLKFIFRDLILVENQIPFWIIELLMDLSCQGLSSWNGLLCEFISSLVSGDVGDSETLVDNIDKRPFHFLGAYYQALKVQFPVCMVPPNSEMSMVEMNLRNFDTYRFRSITNLKTKGIHFKLSERVEGRKVISFTSHKFYGQLHLPQLLFSTNFFVLYSNLIAYEMSPTSNTDFFVSSLVNFMKSLIDRPSDVKILREKGILLNGMVSDDEVVRVIKDLDTFGLENGGAFSEVRDSIEKHCCSKGKTWAAELIHTYFDSPWSTIALLAAILIVVLTFVQTYFTVNPSK